MECPRCGCARSMVVKSQSRTIAVTRRGTGARRTFRFRRRECAHCGIRWTTREEILGGSIGGDAADAA